MSNAKAKGGTGRGTGKKGWNRWQAAEKKKMAKKVFGRTPAAKGAEGEKSANAASGAKGTNPASDAKRANMSKGSTAFKGGVAARGKNPTK